MHDSPREPAVASLLATEVWSGGSVVAKWSCVCSSCLLTPPPPSPQHNNCLQANELSTCQEHKSSCVALNTQQSAPGVTWVHSRYTAGTSTFIILPRDTHLGTTAVSASTPNYRTTQRRKLLPRRSLDVRQGAAATAGEERTRMCKQNTPPSVFGLSTPPLAEQSRTDRRA